MKRKATTIIGFFGILLLPLSGLIAQTSSATWNLTSNGNATVSGNVTATAVSKGAGARPGGISAMTYNSNGVSSTNWIGYTYSQFDITSSYYNKDYYQYTISPSSGNDFTVSSISYTVSASTAPVSWYAYYSLDGFSTYTALGGLNATSHSGLNIVVPAGSTFTLRIFGMDLVSTSTSFRNKSVVISGTAAAPCVPQTANGGSSLSICKGGTTSGLSGSVGGSATTGTWTSNSGGTFTPSASDLDATWTPPSEFTGNATLTLTTTNGCSTHATAHKTVTVNNVTLNNAITNTQNTLAAAETNANYQWIRCDLGNSPVSGATTQTFTPQASGNYAVVLTYPTCPNVTATSECIVVNRDNLGIPGTLQVAGISEFEQKVTMREGLVLEGLENDTIAPSDTSDFSFLIMKDGNGTILKGGFPLLAAAMYGSPCKTDMSGNVLFPTWKNGVNKLFTDCPEVNVGIGNSDPRVKLDVSGRAYMTHLAIGADPINMTGRFHLRASMAANNTSTLFLIENQHRKLMQLTNQGLLQVREVKVDLVAWPDYVFKSDYSLKPLSEVEAFIKSNGHLPNVPNAQTVETEGLNLGEMAKILMEKVEELTLYLIEQNKKLEAQEQRITELQDQLNLKK